MRIEAIDPAIVQLYGALPAAVEEAIVATARDLARTVPPPRHDPYYGLDRLDGPDLRLLQRLSRHGDFRKYVFVLDAGAGLGGPARWLALRYGCRVLGLEVSAARAAAMQRLSARAGLDARVAAVAGSFEAIPAADGTFTQIWVLEALHHATSRRAALAELYRVLRPGSPLALQEIVRRTAAVPQLGGAWRHGTLEEYRATLHAVGFRHVEVEDVTTERAETSPIVLAARDRLLQRLDERLPRDAPWRAAHVALRTGAALATAPDHHVVQIFARRPSV